jgi:glycosyltransferase involved in cell wall biosynthesis
VSELFGSSDGKKGRKLRVVHLHNRYQRAGGEDRVFEMETRLLKERGHQVITWETNNATIRSVRGAGAALAAVWSWRSFFRVARLMRRERPDLAHFHNTFPLISPGAYYACWLHGIPVVQRLPNYRLIAPCATLFRDGQVCEICKGRALPTASVRFGCYRGSRLGTLAVATMLVAHRSLGTFKRRVAAYVALTEFGKGLFVEAGLPAEKIFVKPNFIHPDPGAAKGEGDYAVFVGRLAVEKGVETLLRAWASLRDVPLKIVGDGPLRARVERLVGELGLGGAVTLEGGRETETIMSLVKGARFLVFPSEWYEGFPVTLVEALACGRAVLASRIGGIPEIIDEGGSGLLFEPGQEDDLARGARYLWERPDLCRTMGAAARERFLERFSAEPNYAGLLGIYGAALEDRDSTRARL